MAWALSGMGELRFLSEVFMLAIVAEAVSMEGA